MNNCWISYMLPFPVEERNADRIKVYKDGKPSGDTQTIAQYQEACIDHKIFGMGWDIPGMQNPTENEYLKAAKAFYEQLKLPEEYKKAEKCYFMLKNRIKAGHIIMLRSRNGHYYIGKVKETANPEYLHTGDTPFYQLSWGYHVEKWHEIANDLAVPGLIRGRFSQMYHPTLQAVNDTDLIQVMNMLYEKLAYGKPDTRPPKLTIENFAKFFDYRELEDLVYMYILNENKDKGYALLPSSCKLSQPKYEFWIANGINDIITCQVKNQSALPNISIYNNDCHLTKIYLFSGTWHTDEDAEQYAVGKAQNVYVIKPSQLFSFLKSGKHNDLFLNDYRKID